MNHELDDKRAAIDEQTPNFEELEKYFDERTAGYDVAKKELIGEHSYFALYVRCIVRSLDFLSFSVFKNKKMSLEDTVKRLNRDLEKMSVPRVGKPI
jgi:hypothetical protein